MSVRVVLAGRSRAARLVTRLLADQGATCVMSDEIDPSSRVDAWLARGGCTVRGGGLERLLPRADLLITDGDGQFPVAGNPGLIHVALPSVPVGHPLQGRVLHDAELASLCGLHHDPLSGTPRYTGLAIPSVLAALYAANAAVAALLARARDGRGQVVTVTVLDAALQAQELVAAMTVRPPSHWPSVQWAGSPWVSAYRASCGRFVYLHAGLPAHLVLLLQQLSLLNPTDETRSLTQAVSQDTRHDPTQVPTLREANLTRRLLRAVMAQRSALEWEQDLSRAGLCAVMVREVTAWCAHPQAVQGGAVVEAEAGVQPGLQVELLDSTPTPNTAPPIARSVEDVLADWPARLQETAAADTRPPLTGVRVLDLSQVIAGPVAARTLWELGAHVTRVENPRLDVGFVDAFHALFNAGKRSVVVDLTQPAQREVLLAKLRKHPPRVVVGNWRPGVAQRLGVGAEHFHPHTVDVRVTAYGTRGPWAGWPGWEQTAQAATGMQWAHGGALSPSLFPAAVNDVCTGLFASLGTLCALHRGGPATVTSALSSTATLLQMDTVCGGAQVPSRSRGPHALQRFHTLADGEFLLSVRQGAENLHRVEGLQGEDVGEALRACPSVEWQRRFDRTGLDAVVVPWVGVGRAVKEAMEEGKAWSAPLWGDSHVTVLNHPMVFSATPARHTPAPKPRGHAQASIKGVAPVQKKPLSRLAWLRRQAVFGWHVWRQGF
jgi:crotonobetainyl-CoA:carnitine CoA-transferase CaiB-like acyl-CoA transferase